MNTSALKYISEVVRRIVSTEGRKGPTLPIKLYRGQNTAEVEPISKAFNPVFSDADTDFYHLPTARYWTPDKLSAQSYGDHLLSGSTRTSKDVLDIGDDALNKLMWTIREQYPEMSDDMYSKVLRRQLLKDNIDFVRPQLSAEPGEVLQLRDNTIRAKTKGSNKSFLLQTLLGLGGALGLENSQGN